MATLTKRATLTTEDIAQFLNDFPELNRLTSKPEFTSERVNRAIQFVIDEWNETPPLIHNYTRESFPYRTTLLYGTVGHLFAGESAFQERNHLAYSSGGLSVDDSNKAQPYMQISQYFSGKFKEVMERQKRAENVLNGWGVVPSRLYSRGRR